MPKYNERSIPDSYNQEQKDVALLILDAFDWKRMGLPFRFSSNVFTELEQAYKEVHIDTDVREVMNAAQNNQKNCEYDMSAGLSYLDFVFKTGRNTKTYLTEMDLNVMKIGWIPMILHDFGFQYTLDKLVIVYEATCMRTHPDISCKEAAVVGEHKKLDILKHRNDILKVVLLSLQFAKLSAKEGKGFALGYLIDQDKAYLILVSHQSTDDQLNINSQLQVFKTFDMTQREEVYQLFSVLYTFVRYKKLTKV
ncbi:hypothetical protein C9374_001651 [Naegleria lovaniensis]|uniref:Uncharacterized protein n=1 Tax=Naegleria lovaniensis TaxID=51637 RepID=A0AA88GX59_NAELO|nr:uncharacterized protein C9374_001651 [Naegleria lovaniensis]KAG2387319.1 hypothetical protein C9374_001651 [Naegleria lovaniensis]